MRIFTISVAMCMLATIANAQYKKASFASKSGVSLEITGKESFITKSKCVQPSVAFSVGKEKNDGRYFSWHDFEFLLPAKYSYSTTHTMYYSNANKEEPITVSSKTLPGFAYRFNSGIFLLDNSNENNKVLPFVNFGASILFHAGSDDNTTTYQPAQYGSLSKYPSEASIYAGLNGGVGVIYKITSVIGIKATGGYSFQADLTSIDLEDGSSTDRYGFYKSHPYVTFGFRFLVPRR